jgi:hypothetical protein
MGWGNGGFSGTSYLIFVKICQQAEDIRSSKDAQKNRKDILPFSSQGAFSEPELCNFREVWGTLAKNGGGLDVHILLSVVADETPLRHVQNERCRMMHSPVTKDQKWRNRNLVIFPPFSTPQGGYRGANQKVPLTANSSQVPVEWVGILGGSGPYTVSGIQSAEK